MIPVLVFILCLLFAVWAIIYLYEIAITFLVNFVIAGVIGVRFVHDMKLKNKEIIANYIIALGITLIIYLIGGVIGLQNFYRPLYRFGIVSGIQLLLIFFFISQLLIYRKQMQSWLIKQIRRK